MNILIIDTSTETEIVAACSNKNYSSQSQIIPVSHSKTIFNNIDLALKKLNIKINDINLMGVGIGPGSFTGIRIAVSTARMLAQILGIPLVPISTPYLYAISIPAKPAENLLIAFDAKKNRIFGGLYQKTEDNLKPKVILPAGDYYIDDLLKKLNSKKIHCYGNGITKYQSNILNSNNEIIEYKNFIPSGREICEYTKNIYLQNPGNYDNILKVLPDYTRKSDAEVARNLKTK